MLVIGSRGSQLALWQARWVAARLAELGLETRIEIIKTTGDKITGVPLAKVGAKGLFTKEIEDALLAGGVDLAVHSLKDLPTELPAGLVIAAVPEREDASDALVGKPLGSLAPGARVGTSSLRRSAQLRHMRPDLVVESVRGNVDTRLRKLDEGQYEAIVLASAGLRRLGLGGRIVEAFAPETMCPAVGQGALAIETRDSGPGLDACRRLDHEPTRIAVTAERALLRALGGGCQVPIGAHATVAGTELSLVGIVASPDGTRVIRDAASGPVEDAARIGAGLAQRLLAGGGRGILEEVYGTPVPDSPGGPLTGQTVVVTRARGQADALSRKLESLGAQVIELPTIEIQPAADYGPLDDAIARLGTYDWLIFTSANGVRYFLERLNASGRNLSDLHARICAIGPATREAVEALDLKVDLMAKEYVAEGLVEAFAGHALEGKRMLLPRAAVARDVLPDELARRGALVDVVEAYRTGTPAGSTELVRQTFFEGHKPDWITFTSSSTVGNFAALAGPEALSGVKVASIGPVTSSTARRLGIDVTAEARVYTAEGLAEALCTAVIG